MADRKMPGKVLQNIFVENFRDKSHILMNCHSSTVAGNDASTFLASVLQGI